MATKTNAFVTLERIYSVKGEQKTGSYTVARDFIGSVRASNALGFPQHRSTMLLKDGTEVTLTDRYSEVKAVIQA